MLLFGHRFIKSESFYHISDIEDVSKTPSNSIVYLKFSEENLDIIEYLNNNHIAFALGVKNVTELIYASQLQASFMILSKKMAKTAQNLADNYLFDAKILAQIEKEEEIEELALLGIDGAVFTEAIVKIS